MATKKQQRRRAKGQRHDYEYVYVDEAGKEVDAPAADDAPKSKPATKSESSSKAAPRGRREPKPASWIRALKWGGAYTAFMLIFSTFSAKKGSNITVSLAFSLIVGILIVPAFYWMHRFQYRSYHKMMDREAAKKAARSKR
jgi:hypothetical protein